MSNKAIVLLSGGLDSAVCTGWALREGKRPVGLSIDYGQRHRYELACAARITEHYGMEHVVVQADLAGFGGSTLTQSEIDVPKGDLDEPVSTNAIPSTYVPLRNLVFVSLAAAMAEARGISQIVAGMNAVDYSGYPDCRPDFVAATEVAVNQASKRVDEGGERVVIHTPLMQMTKPEIIQLGISLQVPFEYTSSCYSPLPGGQPCLQCDSCRIRHQAFSTLGMNDPIETDREGRVRA